MALTLRLVCGLTTAEIARAFLVPEPTMAARVTRAKKKISAARIPYRVPGPAELPDRLDAVLTVIHLLYTTGHTAPAGPDLVRADLVERAIGLARMLRELMPDEREARGLLALLLLTDARRATRSAADGRLLLLEEQDRSRWDRAAIAEGTGLVDRGAARRPAGGTGAVRAAGGHRGRARRGAELRRDRLAAAAAALRRAAARLAHARGGAEPRRGARDGRRAGGRPGGYRGHRARRPWRATGTCPRPRPTCCAASAADQAAQAYRIALDLTENAAERAFLARGSPRSAPTNPRFAGGARAAVRSPVPRR